MKAGGLILAAVLKVKYRFCYFTLSNEGKIRDSRFVIFTNNHYFYNAKQVYDNIKNIRSYALPKQTYHGFHLDRLCVRSGIFFMKDPAFLFYPGDWLGGTIGMTFEQKGAYIELLMMQFTRGHMTSHMIGQVVGHHWDILKDKFKQDEQGLWYNERLDIEKEKRKNFVDSRKNNIKGENQFTKKKKQGGHMDGHMTSHMENENINNNIIYGKGKKSITIKKVYVHDKVIKIFDLKEYFKSTNQLPSLEEAGWVNFVGFIDANAGAVFNDPGHVYNTFRNFCKENPIKQSKNSEALAHAKFEKENMYPEAWEKKYAYQIKHDAEFKQYMGL